MTMRRSKLPLLAMLLDTVTVNGAYLIALLLVFRGGIPVDEFNHYRDVAVWVTLLYLAAFYVAGAYDRDYATAGLDDFIAVARAALLG
ncbi:MAG TPA: hypothetical protein PKM88_10370, partial [bacterium]|nr:hypothetical protein [bacterium]